MTHKLLVGAALAVTAAPLVRKYSASRSLSTSTSTGLSTSGGGGGSSPSSVSPIQQGQRGPAAALREYAQRVIRGGEL